MLVEVTGQGGWGYCFEGPIQLYKLLAAQGDDRASALLAAAYQGLTALAEGFADQVPRDICMRSELLAREICDAWAAAQAAQAGLTSGAAAS